MKTIEDYASEAGYVKSPNKAYEWYPGGPGLPAMPRTISHLLSRAKCGCQPTVTLQASWYPCLHSTHGATHGHTCCSMAHGQNLESATCKLTLAIHNRP